MTLRHVSAFVSQDVTQPAPSGGAILDTSKNYTAQSIQQALITVVLKGSNSIFGKLSASNFYLDIEQLSVIHFLDAARFNSIVGLIRAGNAYTISLTPGTGRPALGFTSVRPPSAFIHAGLRVCYSHLCVLHLPLFMIVCMPAIHICASPICLYS